WRRPIKTLRKGETARASAVPGNGHELPLELNRISCLRQQRVRGCGLCVPVSSLEYRGRERQVRRYHAVQRRRLPQEYERVNRTPVHRVGDGLPHPFVRNQIHVEDEEPNLRARPQLHRNPQGGLDRKSTRLNSSHGSISYAVFCLKKKI